MLDIPSSQTGSSFQKRSFFMNSFKHILSPIPSPGLLAIRSTSSIEDSQMQQTPRFQKFSKNQLNFFPGQPRSQFSGSLDNPNSSAGWNSAFSRSLSTPIAQSNGQGAQKNRDSDKSMNQNLIRAQNPPPSKLIPNSKTFTPQSYMFQLPFQGLIHNDSSYKPNTKSKQDQFTLNPHVAASMIDGKKLVKKDNTIKATSKPTENKEILTLPHYKVSALRTKKIQQNQDTYNTSDFASSNSALRRSSNNKPLSLYPTPATKVNRSPSFYIPPNNHQRQNKDTQTYYSDKKRRGKSESGPKQFQKQTSSSSNLKVINNNSTSAKANSIKQKRKKGRPKKQNNRSLQNGAGTQDDDNEEELNSVGIRGQSIKRKRNNVTRDQKISREISSLIVIDAIQKEAMKFNMNDKVLNFKKLQKLRIKQSLLNYKQCHKIWDRFKTKLQGHAKRNQSFRYLRRQIEEDIFPNYSKNLLGRIQLYDNYLDDLLNADDIEEDIETQKFLSQICGVGNEAGFGDHAGIEQLNKVRGLQEEDGQNQVKLQEEKGDQDEDVISNRNFILLWDQVRKSNQISGFQDNWTVDDLLSLLRGIQNLGQGQWDSIKEDQELLQKRSKRELSIKWSELKTLMLNDLQQINQERISYKYNIQNQKAAIRNPRATTLIPSAFIQNTSFPNSLRRVTINKWEWLSAAIKKLEGDSYMPILDQKIYTNSDQIYHTFQDDKKGQIFSSKDYNRNQYFLTVRQERHQHQNHNHHHSSNGQIYSTRCLQSINPNNRMARAMTRNQKVQADLLERQEYEITKSTRESIFHKYHKVYKQMADLENEGCQNQALSKQLLASEQVINTKQVIHKLFQLITQREEQEAKQLCIMQEKKRNIRRKKQNGQLPIVNPGNKRGRKKMVKNEIKVEPLNISNAFQIIKESNLAGKDNSTEAIKSQEKS